MATLKVRVRAASGGPTMRVQVPWPFTVQALKDVISPLIMRPTSSFCLSLNKKAAIGEGPGTTSLSDFGVINGDLLFYISREGGDSSSSAAPPQPAADVLFAHLNKEVATELASTSAAPSTSHSLSTGKTVEDHGFKGDSTSREGEGFTSMKHEEDSSMSLISNSTNLQQKSNAPASLEEGTCSSQNQGTVVPMHVSNTTTTSVEPTLAAPAGQEVKNVDSTVQFSGDDAMEVEIKQKGGLQFPVEIAKHHVSIPDLLQRVLSVEYGNVKEPQELLVLAVHAVMLETGFVLSGEVSSSQGSYVLPTGWSGKGGQVNLTYTLPEIKRESKDAGSHTFVGDMVLRSQIVGNVLVVYGVTTSGRGYEVHRVSLPVSSFLNEESVLNGTGSAGNAPLMVHNLIFCLCQMIRLLDSYIDLCSSVCYGLQLFIFSQVQGILMLIVPVFFAINTGTTPVMTNASVW
jgi:F-box protein 7